MVLVWQNCFNLPIRLFNCQVLCATSLIAVVIAPWHKMVLVPNLQKKLVDYAHKVIHFKNKDVCDAALHGAECILVLHKV